MMRVDRQTDKMNLIATVSKPKHIKREMILYKIFGILKPELIIYHSDVFVPTNLFTSVHLCIELDILS
jgi:hypothetical protein